VHEKFNSFWLDDKIYTKTGCVNLKFGRQLDLNISTNFYEDGLHGTKATLYISQAVCE
jgi:hypothetical protein